MERATLTISKLRKSVKSQTDGREEPLSEYGYSGLTGPLGRIASATVKACASAVAVSCYAGFLGIQKTLGKIQGKGGEGPEGFQNGLVLAGVSLPGIRNQVQGMLAQIRRGETFGESTDYASLVSDQLIRKHSLKTGFFGGLTSAPGTLPGMGTLGTVTVTLTADLVHLLRAQVELCYGVSAAYGVKMTDEELQAVALALIGYSGSAEAAHNINAQVIRQIIDQAAQTYLATGMKKAVTILLQKIGSRSSGRLVKALPFLGIPLGVSINVASIRLLGNNAKAYFNTLREEGPANEI